MLRYKSTDQNKFYTFNNKEIQNTIQLTGLIIVKNQEKYIIDSLHSLNTVCDRIVVVDTGSTDNTVKNIKNFFPNVELKHLEWRENYVYIRNAALNFVKDGWIFVLDSDETFQKMCTYDELHNFLGWLEINNANKELICTTKCCSNGYSSFVRKKNLYKVSPHLKYHGIVHEELVSDKSNLQIIDTDLEVLNKGTDREQVQKFDKEKRYSRLLLQQIKLEPQNPRWLSLMSLSYVDLGLVSADFLRKEYQYFLFKDKVNDFSLENIIKNKYLKYNLFRYVMLLVLYYKDFKSALSGAEAGIKLFPSDSNYVSLYISVKNEELNLEYKKLLRMSLNKLNDYKNQLELVHEESQGSENALDELMVRLLVKLGYYGEAKQIFKSIDVPVYRNNLKAELELFNLA